MDILRDGSFSFEINAAELSRGLRPSRYSPRNTKFLTECKNAVGIDGVLQIIRNSNELLLDTAVITDGFPYPQIFVFTNTIIVCGETDIYEWVAGALVHRLGPLDPGVTWSAVDLYDFIYMSNGMVSVVRTAENKNFELALQPLASAICNYNGQILIGAPNVEMA